MNDQPQESGPKWMGAGMFTALFASLCCITPVFALLAGIGGIGAAFSWVEPFRPYLIGITVFLLGLAWYQKLKPRDGIDCECEDTPNFWQSTGFLGIVTLLVVILLAFPYYSDAFFPSYNQGIEQVQENRFESVSLQIRGMTCGGCAASVEHAANSLDGVIKAEASYNTGMTHIQFDPARIGLKDIEAAINKTGFTVAGVKEGDSELADPNAYYNAENFCPLHGEGNCSGTCQARSSCTVEHLDRTLAESVDEDVDVEVTKLDNSLEALKNAFNSQVQRPRFVAVLSSVCRWCIDWARKIKASLLEQDGTDNFRLYIVWIDMLDDDNYATAQKAAGLLHDPRVTHFYASGKHFGRKIAYQVSGKEGVAWDIYMFYDSDTRWEHDFPAPSDYIHQLNPDYYSWVDKERYYSGEELEKQIADLVSIYKTESQ